MEHGNKIAFCLGIKYKESSKQEKDKIDKHIKIKPLESVQALFFEKGTEGLLNIKEAYEQILLKLPAEDQLKHKNKLGIK